MTNPKHTDTSRSDDLVKWLREEASFAYHRAEEDMLTEAADHIEALEAALRIIVRETTAVSPDVLNQQMCIDAVNRHAIAALGDGL